MIFVLKYNGLSRTKVCLGIVIIGSLITLHNTLAQGVDEAPVAPRINKMPAPVQAAMGQEQRLMLLARRYEDSGDFGKALDAYKKLADIQPNSPVYYEGVLRNALYLKDYDQALATIEKYKPRATKRVPSDPLSTFGLEVDRGLVLWKMGQTDSASVLWRTSLDKVGFDYGAYMKMFQTLWNNRLQDQAVDMVMQARKHGAAPSFMAMELGMMLRFRNDYAGAARELLNAYRANPGQFSEVFREFSSFPTDGIATDSVVAVLKEALPIDQNQAVRRLLIGYLFKTRQYDQALAEVKALDSLSQDKGGSAFEFAQQFLKENRISHARELFQRLVVRDGVDDKLRIAARLGLARCLEQEGKFQDALTQYEELSKIGMTRGEGREARFRAGMVRLQDLHNPAQAKEDFKALLSAGAVRLGDQEVGLWLGDCYAMTGDLESARSSYQQAMDRTRGKGEGVPAALSLRLARVALWSGEFQKAGEILQGVVQGRLDDETVNDVIVWQRLVSESEGDSTALVKFAEGDLLSFQLKSEQAIGAFQDVRTASPKGRVGQEALVRIGLELRALGRPRAAVDSLQQFLTLFPSSLQVDDVQFLIGDILERDVRDIPGAIKQYEQLLIEHPGGMYMEEARRRIRQLESYRQT